MSEKNCWEFQKCGREPGGAKVEEFGACPAATEIRANGVNGGKNGGRACWAICGTMCGGIIQGTYAAKIGNCRACEFYLSVKRDFRTCGQSSTEYPSGVLDIVLERTASLEQEIEHRMQVEDALRQANTKLNILSNITRHDMLNKINILVLLSDLLGDKYPHDPVIREYREKIDRQLLDLTEIVMFTSDYQDLGVHAPIWQRLYQVLSGVQKMAQSLTIEADTPLGEYEIYADPLLTRAFYNLADNTIRHSGGVTRITVHGITSSEGLVIVWEDNGVGVAQTDKEKIFRKGHGKNTGLGLFLVREILSITGIGIQETGIPGAGVRFEIIVPGGSYRRADP
jgi:signal transduction histidine kinase